MADFDGMTADEIEAQLGQMIVSGAIDGTGNMIFTRKNGETINAGVFVQPAVHSYPVGSVFITESAADPATTLGGGTWVQYAKGRCLVGQDPAQAEFDTIGETGGAKTHALTVAQMPPHTHEISGLDHSPGVPTGPFWYFQTANSAPGDVYGIDTKSTGGSGGSAQPHNNLQPYIVVYFWKRTA